jgi:hypothetical protein
MTQAPRRLSGHNVILAAAVAAVGGACFVSPIAAGWDRWGIADWDQHQFFYGVSRWSIVERWEPPFWNPFACGGNADLANPQSPALYPPFGVVLVAGVVPGLKILVWLHAALAIFGAWLFGRRCGCGRVAAWLPAAAFGLSSAYALHIAAGHATWFAMAWAPFALAALRSGFEKPAAAFAGGAAAAMMLFAGNAYLFGFLLLFSCLWAVLESSARRSVRPAAAAAFLVAAACGLAAVKLVPMVVFLGKVTSLDVPDLSSGDLYSLWHALLGRDQSLEAFGGVHARQFWGWWEYGAYVGPVIPFLAVLGFLREPGRAWPMAVVAAAAMLLALGQGWGLWDLLRGLPALGALRVASRVIVFAVLFLGALAGQAAGSWEPRMRHWLLAGAIALVALDIGWVGQRAFREAFAIEPGGGAAPRGEFRQEIGRKDFWSVRDRQGGPPIIAYTDQYPRFLTGRGTVNCYDRSHLPARVLPATLAGGSPNPWYRGEAWLTSGGSARLARLGGRRIMAVVEPAAATTLVVNQNFDSGWLVAGGRPTMEYEGLLAAAVTPEDREIVFIYSPPGLAAGAAITLLTLASWAVVRIAPPRRRRGGTACASSPRPMGPA